MILWTRRELIFFVILATLATFLFEILDFKWLQIPLTPVGLIGTAVAFLVSFQNNAAYDRIWEARKIWGGIVNASRTLIIMAKDSFYVHSPEKNQSEKENIEIITHRHIAWLNALRYAMRTKKEWEGTYQNQNGKQPIVWNTPEFETPLEDTLKPHLSTEEYEYVMTKDNKPNAIINLQSQHFRKLTDENKYWEFTLLRLQKILQELTALQGKSERIKNFPYPKQYGSIAYHLVHIFMWLLPLAIIPTFARMGVEVGATHPIIGAIFIWFNIPCTVIVIWVFNTMLRIGMAGENPFEGSASDVPISNISRGITRDILQIIDADEATIPPPLENMNDIHM